MFLLSFEDFAVTGGSVTELDAFSEAGTIRVIDARLLLKEPEDGLVLARASDLSDSERADLRAAAGALIGLGAGAVAAGEEGAVAGAVLGADAAMGAGEFGLSQEDIDALGDEMEVGDALLGYSRPAEE